MRIFRETDASGQRWVKMIGAHGDGEGELKVRDDVRKELAMALLGLDGEQIKVSFLPPPREKVVKTTKGPGGTRKRVRRSPDGKSTKS